MDVNYVWNDSVRVCMQVQTGNGNHIKQHIIYSIYCLIYVYTNHTIDTSSDHFIMYSAPFSIEYGFYKFNQYLNRRNVFIFLPQPRTNSIERVNCHEFPYRATFTSNKNNAKEILCARSFDRSFHQHHETDQPIQARTRYVHATTTLSQVQTMGSLYKNLVGVCAVVVGLLHSTTPSPLRVRWAA